MELHVRRAQAGDREELLAIWERSVRATHHFLDDADVVTLRPLVAEELAGHAVDWWVLVSSAGALLGFLGMSGNAIEGLFLDPAHLRQGAGRFLLAHAESLCPGPLTVEVNEQNEEARRFYESVGFVVDGRSPTDSGGRPFPLLHMTRR
ncbi:MAG TPA: GNAT family N-acetyltransferase [Polyangiaceae bacterium]|jgi:putative acetyltransferase|nr:GNAT family N-acetyltransferase [Polyangiaceae bacterium]